MTAISELRIDCLEAERIIKRLSNHWRHKFSITQQQNVTTIPFSEQVVSDLIAFEDHLLARIKAANNEQLDRYEQVVLSHLNRMAAQDYSGDWMRIEP